MEQIVILVVFVIASIVSSIVQNKKKREAEEAEAEGRTWTPGEAKRRPPFESWPQSTGDWQEELRKLFEPETAPPPVIAPRPAAPSLPSAPAAPTTVVRQGPVPPQMAPVSAREPAEGDVVFASPLTASNQAYMRAAGLNERVQNRMKAVELGTELHRAATLGTARSDYIRWARHPRRVREALVASVILGPPVALRPRQGGAAD